MSLWIAAGANPKQIAAWAGHTSTSIVLDRYGHLYDGNEADVLARLDTFLTKPDADAASPWIPRVLRGNGKPPNHRGQTPPTRRQPDEADLSASARRCCRVRLVR